MGFHASAILVGIPLSVLIGGMFGTFVRMIPDSQQATERIE
jgi:hypothetical protein